MQNITINTNNLLDKNSEAESEILKNLNKKRFFKIMNENDIDFDKVINRKKTYNSDFHKFNLLIKNLCEKKIFNMIDVAVYLYTDLFKESNVFECFNEHNMYELRKEFSRKYNITLDTNILKYFLF